MTDTLRKVAEQAREALAKVPSGLTASYDEKDAEWRGHDKAGDRANKIVREVRDLCADALAALDAALAAEGPATPSDAELVGIWSCEYDAWWRPNACGYTKDSACAGVWSRSEAEKIADAEKEKHLIARTIPIHPDAAAAIERLTRDLAAASLTFKI